MSSERKMLVTSALPYANGPLHLGHVVEAVQMDIWVRAHKMQGISCLAVCGDDAHGTPIMLKAEALGISPQQLTKEVKASHEADFKDFGIHYDSYHSTHSAENEALAADFYACLQARGDIVQKKIDQAFDPVKGLFLPDRYVKGTCPKCKTPGQYGDSCEACGAIYSPTDLLDPISALSGSTPIVKESEHYFFDLPRYESILKDWVFHGHLQPEVANKLEEWFSTGLKMWDISRDAPYFGFLIPGTKDKYFYVWLDAPIGYMAAFKQYCSAHNASFDAYWNKESKAELYHFVGKDIVYFHALFWPALLSATGYRLPTAIFAHGFLTINGLKMSKSRGTFINARTYLNHLNPEYLRYYFAAKLNGTVEDLDLHFDDFTLRVNADLVGKVVNIASRCAGFISKRFDNKLSCVLAKPSLYKELLGARERIIAHYNARDYAQVVRVIMSLADKVNQYIDNAKPWVLAKDPEKAQEVQAICTMGLNAYCVLITYLKPILPVMAKASEDFLQTEALHFATIDTPLLDKTIKPFTALITRVEPEKIEALLAEAKAACAPHEA